jgi:hypothetical protein
MKMQTDESASQNLRKTGIMSSCRSFRQVNNRPINAQPQMNRTKCHEASSANLLPLAGIRAACIVLQGSLFASDLEPAPIEQDI